MCCAYKEYNYDTYTNAYGINSVLHCKYVNPESIAGVTILGLFIVGLFTGLTTYAIIQQSKKKRSIAVN